VASKVNPLPAVEMTLGNIVVAIIIGAALGIGDVPIDVEIGGQALPALSR